ncbi:unnamed protein product [Lactuca virosa]|uniref:Exocyst subunit Exo70 family protein n=1 Tax=Lactuca virosa TaxID=75947 RepID=A0AAU9M016_9ASTR|nr:unnamed protein product [Lactuca virosa]
MEPVVNDGAAEQIILRWDATASEDARVRMIFDGDRQEIERYLQAVDQIQRSMDSTTLSDDDQQSTKVNNAIQIAMARLEDEFRNILITNSTPIETESVTESISSTRLTTRTNSSRSESPENDDCSNRGEDDAVSRDGSSSFPERSATFESCRSMTSIREQDLIPSESIADLRCIAERMFTAGYSRECVQVYGSVRKSVVDGSFKKLGVEKLSIGDIQRLEWDALNTKIGRWIRAVKICVRVLFASEKKLCKQIFEDLGTAADDACFMETVKGPAIQLFNFVEAISISRRSPEKLFKILDLHDSLLDLLPDIDDVFDSKPAESIKTQATEILSRLAEAARGMLSEFEGAVLREPSRVPVPGGTIHPLTRYSDNSTTPDMDFTDHEGQSPLALHLIWIIAILQFNLEGKSKHYKDNSLAHLFIMNNVHYIVQKIKGSSELREMIGDQYLRTLTRIFRQAATNHQRATWVGVLRCLRDEGLHTTKTFSSAGVSKSSLRERFKSFNAIFDEVHRTQSLWLIPDEQLREELRISILETLIPAYRSFLGRFRNHIESGRHPENYIKYSVEDLETAVLDLFEGYAASQHSRRRSQ